MTQLIHTAYMDGLRNQPARRADSPTYEIGYRHGKKDFESGFVIPQYFGPVDLCVKRGNIITIKKHSIITTTYPNSDGKKIAKRDYNVRVFSVIPGMEAHLYHDNFERPTVPQICWPGRGGYWNYVDVNNIIGV